MDPLRADKMILMFMRAYSMRVGMAALLVAAAGAAGAAVGGAAGGGVLGVPTVKGNVSIALPKSWVVSPGGGDVVLVALAPSPDKDMTGQFQATLSISQDAGNKVDGAAVQTALGKSVTGYRAVETPTPVTINGLTGVAFGGTYKSLKGDVRTRQYMFTVNNEIYTIVFTSLNSTWGNYQAGIQTSIATFAVKK